MFEKSALIAEIQSGRAAFEAALQRLPAGQLEQPIAPGRMSPKEVVYHIAWHERQMAGMLRSQALVGSPWWELPTDERNAHIQAEARPLSVEAVMAYASAAIAELLAALEALPGEALNDPHAFAGMPADWIPGDLIVQNTYEHYRDHLGDREGYIHVM